MRTFALILAIIVLTIIGDYWVKVASQRPNGLASLVFVGGASMYALSAAGWLLLMRSHSLAAIGVIYSSVMIVVLAGLGFFVFKEAFGLREGLGVALAVAAVLVIGH